MRRSGAHGEEGAAGAVSGFRLVALSGEGTLEFDLPARGELTVGRTTAAFVALADPSVSRAHAVLRLDHGTVTVADQRSRNGTFVNGVQVKASEVFLRPGDEVRFGAVAATLVERARGGAPAPTVPLPELDVRLAAEAERAVRNERPLAALCLAPVQSAPETLRAVAEVAAASLRSYDLLAVGAGLQIEVLLPECTQDGALRIAQRMDAALRAKKLAARIGVAAFPATAPSVESLVPSADVARLSVPHAGVGVARGATRILHVGGRAVVAAHPTMLQVFALVERMAQGVAPVLVVGERGAGTTTVADAIHALGPRAERPLVHLDCATTPAAELAAALLGVEGQGEPGAGTATVGMLEFAAGGTVVLQEIGHLPPELQVAVLRVLQTRTSSRVGASAPLPVDVRVVATSSTDLELAVREGSFRRDLNLLFGDTTVAVPPLRARRGEVPLLARWFVEEAAREQGRAAPTLSPGVEAAFRRHAWNGNLDELWRVVAAAVARCDGGEIQVAHLEQEVARTWFGADDGSGWDARSFDDTSVVPFASPPVPVAPELTPEPAPPPAPPPEPAPPVAAAPETGAPAPADVLASLLERPYDEAVEEVQRLLVRRAVDAAGGDMPRAAKLLGVDKRRLGRLVNRLGVER